jgi:hypothetical protein
MVIINLFSKSEITNYVIRVKKHASWPYFLHVFAVVDLLVVVSFLCQPKSFPFLKFICENKYFYFISNIYTKRINLKLDMRLW